MWLSYKVKAGSLLLILLVAVQLLAGCTVGQKSVKQTDSQKPTQEQLQKLELLNQTADEMYKRVMQGDLAGGRAVLQQLSEQIPQIRYEGVTTLEGLNALTETIAQGKRVFNTVNLSPEEGQVSVATIRLATDALTHAEEPMWMQYYRPLQDDLDQMERAIQAQKKPDLIKADAKLRQHITIIHPSLLINRDPIEVEKLDSLVLFISEQIRSEQELYKQILNVMPNLRNTIDVLFLRKEATAYLPIIDDHQPILWTFIIGSIIVSVLGFAAWRLARKDDGVITIHKHHKSLEE
jgi:sporulation protein YpjB